MDLSKFKLEVYDFLAITVPGILMICELWVTLRGWSSFAQGITTISATGFTLLLFVGFALGPLVQESADILIKVTKGKRYFKSTRDRVWNSLTGEHVKIRILKQLGHEVENVDVAFDYCLSRIQHSFSKRDMFVATSDMARSLVVVSFVAIAPLVRLILDLNMRKSVEFSLFFLGLLLLALVASVFWARMTRFRELSETPVFHAYLAQPDEAKKVGEMHVKEERS